MSSLEGEEWRHIYGYTSYMVSNMARVKSLYRKVKIGKGYREIKESILTTFICKQTGYPQVALSRKKQNVHRLVAFAFLGSPVFGKTQVNHINGDRGNSKLSNLEWVTPSENIKFSFLYNGRVQHNKGKFGKESSNSIAVISTSMITGIETRYESMMDAVREGFDSGCICRVCKGKYKQHSGYLWRYA